MDAIKMSAKAWSEVKMETIKKSWKKTGVWNKTEEPTQDDDEEDEDPVADFRNIIVQLSGPQLNNMDVADCLACDAALDGQEKMTDEEIQETVTNQEEEQIPQQSTGPSAQAAIQDLDNIFKKFL